MDKFCLLSNDVETTSIWHNSLRDETGLKWYGAWFSNMIRKSNNAFSEEKMWKKLARENKED